METNVFHLTLNNLELHSQLSGVYFIILDWMPFLPRGFYCHFLVF